MNFIFCVLPLIVFTTLSHADVFECIDEAGRTIYRDAQCVAGEVLKQEINILALEKKTNVSAPHVDVKDVHGWQALEINDLAAPPGTHSAHLELIQTIKGQGRFSMYWDDVYFKAVGREQE